MESEPSQIQGAETGAHPESNGNDISPSHTEYSDEVLADLARSGLTREDAQRAGVYEASEKELRHHYGSKVAKRALVKPVYAFPYFDPITGHDTGYRRYRFLDGKDDDENPKYLGLSGWASPLYFPKSIDWVQHLRDRKKVYFTEGEKSSYRAGKAGIPTIGLGGCWNFSGRKNAGQDLSKAFGQLNLNGLEVEIIAESDATTNGNVLGALHGFAYALSTQGARVEHVILPPKPDGKKQGIDDYLELKQFAILDFRKLRRESFNQINNLFLIREKYAVVVDEPAGAMFNLRTRHPVLKESYLTAVAPLKAAVPNAKGELHLVGAGSEYIKWPFRREYGSIVYAPSQPHETTEGDYNLWPGWGVNTAKDVGIEPKRGDVTLWNELLDHIFGKDTAERKWFEQWASYPFAHPGAKLFTAVMMWGCQGAGKSLVGEVLRRVYGLKNSSELQLGQLTAHFNEWAKHKQFVLANEMAGDGDRRVEASQIKNVITREEITIDVKNQPEYTIFDTLNYYLTSNRPDAAYLEDGDRRFFVWFVEKALHFSKGAEIKAWSATKEAQSALLYHFMYEVPFDGFEPTAPAPMTDAKAAMQQASDTGLQGIAKDLMNDDARPKYATRGMLRIWAGREPKDYSKDVQVANALLRAGAIRIRQYRLKIGAPRELVWCLRPSPTYDFKNLNVEQVRAYFNEHSDQINTFFGVTLLTREEKF